MCALLKYQMIFTYKGFSNFVILLLAKMVDIYYSLYNHKCFCNVKFTLNFSLKYDCEGMKLFMLHSL